MSSFRSHAPRIPVDLSGKIVSNCNFGGVQREFHRSIVKNDDRLRARKIPMPVVLVLSETVLVIVIEKAK
ncbi:uncharacterized protein Dvar_74520 [Desulfosarcina variabilis str. Montpellier]